MSNAVLDAVEKGTTDEARAVGLKVLRNLSASETNQVPMFNTPRLVSVVLGALGSQDELKKEGLAVFLNLAQTESNRARLVANPKILPG